MKTHATRIDLFNFATEDVHLSWQRNHEKPALGVGPLIKVNIHTKIWV